MATSHATRRLFVCGYKDAIPRNHPVPNLIFSDVKKLGTEGFDVSVHLVHPNTPQDQAVEEVRQKLAGKTFDGVAIGFGLRGNPDLTPLFEDLVNTVIRHVQPAPRMIFTENIDKLYISVRRAFPKDG